MKKILATTLIFSAIGLGVIAFGVGGSPRPNPNADAVYHGPDVDNTSAIVQLKGDPLTTNLVRSRCAAEKSISMARR